MKLWALSDPHLTLATPQKVMHVFGENWRDHEAKIEARWRDRVAPDDVVLVPGDISWASRLTEALTDLAWLDRLPGTKVLLEGNHDHWWESGAKLRRHLPPSLRIIEGDHLVLGPWCFYGTRLWEHEEIRVDDLVAWNRLTDKTPDRRTEEDRQRNARLYERELARLHRILPALPQRPGLRRVCLTHYPPIGQDLAPTRATALVERSGADLCVFGHIHSVKPEFLPPRGDLMGTARGVRYVLASADYRDFTPVPLDESG